MYSYLKESRKYTTFAIVIAITFLHRQYSIGNIQYKVMCGVLDVYCMKYGVWGMNHLKKMMI